MSTQSGVCVQQASEQNNQTTEPDKADRQWFRSVGLRVLTAVVGIPIVAALIWLGGWWVFVGSFLAAVLGVYELHTMLVHTGYRPSLLVSLALTLLFLVSAMLPQQRLLLLEVGISAVLLISFPLLFFRKRLDGALLDWALTLTSALYLGWPLSFLEILRGYDVGLSNGFWWLLTLFAGVWAFDSGAFFAGHFLGRHRLAPRISPAKSWEGVAGGLVLSVLATALCTTLPMGVPWYLAVVLGILIAVAATLGDLSESLIKRQTHVKDSGQFLPGHGGILDRLDSLIFGALVVYIFAQLIGKL